jgi:hypothetical protein
VDWWILGLIVLVGIIWWFGRQPYHHRRIRPDEFADFFLRLVYDLSKGSKLFVEDEITKCTLRFERRSEHLLVVEPASGCDETAFASAAGELARADTTVTPDPTGSSSEISLPLNAAHFPAARIAQRFFQELGSSAGSTYHLFFRANHDPYSRILRDQHDQLSRSSSSPFWRKVHRFALKRIRAKRREREDR